MSNIPIKEEAALRFAFEATMAKTFGWQDFSRTTADGYANHQVQAAWFAARCGWLSGNSAPASRSRDQIAPLLNAFGELHWKSGRGQAVSHEQIADAFEAIIAAATDVSAAAPSMVGVGTDKTDQPTATLGASHLYSVAPSEAQRLIAKGTALRGLADYLRTQAQQTLNNCDRSGVDERTQRSVDTLREWANEVDTARGVKGDS